MKKVLIGMAAIALAMSAQAVHYAQWKTLAPGSTEIKTAGYTCYCISASSMTTLMKPEEPLAVSDVGKVASWLQEDFDTRYAQVVDAGYATIMGTYGGAVEARHPSNPTGNIFGVITYQKSGSEDVSFRVFNLNNKTTIQDFATSSTYQGYWTDWNGTEPVPEPTSGILLLLGVAGLALKRKQK